MCMCTLKLTPETEPPQRHTMMSLLPRDPQTNMYFISFQQFAEGLLLIICQICSMNHEPAAYFSKRKSMRISRALTGVPNFPVHLSSLGESGKCTGEPEERRSSWRGRGTAVKWTGCREIWANLEIWGLSREASSGRRRSVFRVTKYFERSAGFLTSLFSGQMFVKKHPYPIPTCCSCDTNRVTTERVQWRLHTAHIYAYLMNQSPQQLVSPAGWPWFHW